MARIYRESAEQQSLFHWAALYDAHYPQLRNMFAIPNGGKRNPREAARLKREGVRAGVPDIFLAYPGNWGNRNGDCDNGLFIEMKTAAGKISKFQEEWFYKLQFAKFAIEVCYTWQEAARTICEYLELEPEKLGL